MYVLSYASLFTVMIGVPTIYVFHIKHVNTCILDSKQSSMAAASEEDEEELISKIEDELDQKLTDPIKQSTVDYYLNNKDKVSSYLCNSHYEIISAD